MNLQELKTVRKFLKSSGATTKKALIKEVEQLLIELICEDDNHDQPTTNTNTTITNPTVEVPKDDEPDNTYVPYDTPSTTPTDTTTTYIPDPTAGRPTDPETIAYLEYKKSQNACDKYEIKEIQKRYYQLPTLTDYYTEASLRTWLLTGNEHDRVPL